jgi:hypothetical protein
MKNTEFNNSANSKKKSYKWGLSNNGYTRIRMIIDVIQNLFYNFSVVINHMV